jgi:3-oxoacyl-[acyl-carrier protein] reductase
VAGALNLRSYEQFQAEAKDMTADSTVAEIEAAGGTALGIDVDVRDHEAVEAMVARVVQEWGGVDALVANAGGGRSRPIDNQSQHSRSGAPTACRGYESVRDRLFDLRVASIMKRQRSGNIITVSSSRARDLRPMAATPIMGQRRPLPPITPAIWRRFSGRSASPPTASRPT